MRIQPARSALAALTGTALLAAAPAAIADDDLTRRAAERSAGNSLGAASGSRAHAKLPLPEPQRRTPAAAREDVALRAIDAPARLLVGVRRHEDMDGVAARLEREGGDVRRLDSVGVLAFTADSAATAAAHLRADPRVAFVERNRTHQRKADPFTDNIDPGTGIPYDWAFDKVRAPQALAEVGGGSDKKIAIIDTGGDVGHPDLAANIAGQRNVVRGSSRVTDTDGHGTFVAGTIGMVHDNGIGGRGVAGRTPILVVKTDTPGGFTVEDIVAAIEYSIRSRARIINMSLGGESLTRAEGRALDLAFFEDVLPVAAAGNEAQEGNPVEYPAATVGGDEGVPGIGLAVGASRPDDTPAAFSNHRGYVSLAAPGSGQSEDCPYGVLSSVPRKPSSWDDPDNCYGLFEGDGGKWAYGPGTSFASPIAAGVSALAWQAEPRLQSQQVAEVMMRSARQTLGEPGTWNEFTGTGIVDGEAAVRLARVYDVVAPTGMTARQARKGGSKITVRVSGGVDGTDEGDELAGGVQHFILLGKNGRDADVVVSGDETGAARTFRLRKGTRYQFVGAACDNNGNCDVRRLRTVKRR